MKSKLIDQKISRIPLEYIEKRVTLFLKPQLNSMWELDGNKFAFVDFSSLMYILLLAQSLGGRPIYKEEEEKLLLSILGHDFKPRVDALFKPVIEGAIDKKALAKTLLDIKAIAESDAQSGVFGSSNYLFKIAKESSIWQRSIKEFEY